MSKLVPNHPSGDSDRDVPEDELDDLLDQVEAKKARRSQLPTDEPAAIDIFRTRMRQVYLPVFEELMAKYESKGVRLEMDADELLGGGSSLKFKFAFESLTLELDGTIMRGGVAFYLIRSFGNTQGAVVSGPMLRIRNLSAEQFRKFVVEHVRILIKDALRRA